jgi:hypothetical protein
LPAQYERADFARKSKSLKTEELVLPSRDVVHLNEGVLTRGEKAKAKNSFKNVRQIPLQKEKEAGKIKTAKVKK